MNNCDVTWNGTCVIGAGPAGLAAALRLADHGVPVLLVDGGGPDIAGVDPALLDGDIASSVAATDRRDRTLASDATLYHRSYLTETRYRGPGGSSWRWGVRGRPDASPSLRLVSGHPSDFEPRPDLDIPGWPGGAAPVLDRIPQAMAFFGLDGHDFDVARYDDGRAPLGIDPTIFPRRLFHFAPGEHVYRHRVADADRHEQIRFQRGWTLVEIRTNASGERVEALTFVDRHDAAITVSAPNYVLALGGIETSRQLLLAAEAGQLDNRHDTFGRWFMDHPHLRLGYLTGDTLDRPTDWYDFQPVESTFVLRGHELSPDVAEQQDLLRFAVDLVGRHGDDATATGRALVAARDALARRRWRAAAGQLPAVVRHPGRALGLARAARSGRVHNTALGGWSTTEPLLPIGALSVEAMFEQRPSADNRIRLSHRLDRHGRRLPVLQWSWSRIELDAVGRAADLLASELRRAGIERFVPMTELGEGPVPRAGSGAHHLGGTRMSDDPTAGVVDRTGRVHGTTNLYVTGSSVFPTSVGYANPTLTVVADSFRLADDLARSLSPA